MNTLKINAKYNQLELNYLMVHLMIINNIDYQLIIILNNVWFYLLKYINNFKQKNKYLNKFNN